MIREHVPDCALTTDIIVGFPGEAPADFEETITLLDEVQYDGVFGFKYSPRPNTPALKMIDSIAEEEKSRRLSILLERQREIQRQRYIKYVGSTVEVMVEGRNETRNQWIGRTSQNKTLNFTAPEKRKLEPGTYVQVKVTGSFPNSLLGEVVS
jgi:tRNA-2-methylthio-N6-dimethylallyladenosine synthase